MNKDELRKEFTLQFLGDICDVTGMFNREKHDEIFDWFLSKLSQRDSEWIEAIEGMKKEHHENNWQRGCVKCVEQRKINQAFSDLKEKMGGK